MTVSRETCERLECYQAMLQKWNTHINLIASSTLSDIKLRHIEDCLQLADLVQPDHDIWADFGSGGGLPGLVVAIAKAETKTSFTLIESDRRKVAFLRAVIRETGLNRVTVISERIETIPPLNAAYVSARALAPLCRLMAYLDLHLAPSGKAFLMKGRQWQAEIEDARRHWAFEYVAHPSQTQDGAAILEVSGVRHGA